ncbi:MAG: hypothetical protein ACYCTY_13000 [Sulfuricella sp.]
MGEDEYKKLEGIAKGNGTSINNAVLGLLQQQSLYNALEKNLRGIIKTAVPQPEPVKLDTVSKEEFRAVMAFLLSQMATVFYLFQNMKETAHFAQGKNTICSTSADKIKKGELK